MLFFLSSSARNQYAEDILRAIALPERARLRFRYDLSLVQGFDTGGDHSRLLKQILDEPSNLNATDALICFLESNEKRRPVTVYPCRACKVISLEVFGPVLLCFLELGEFCSSSAPANFTAKLAEGADNPIPVWVEGEAEPKLSGAWVFEKQPDTALLGSGSGFGDFARVCDSLAYLHPFHAGESAPDPGQKDDSLNPFWHMSLYAGDIRADATSSVSSATLDQALKPCNGEFALQGGEHYTLRVFHYYPAHGKKKRDFARALEVDVSNISTDVPSLVSMPIKSEYDVKDIVLRPARAPLDRSGFIDLALRSDLSGSGYKFSEVGVPVKIERSLIYTISNVLLIGLGFVIPAIIASSYRDGFTILSWQVFFIGVSGVIGGIAAVFGLRRSV